MRRRRIFAAIAVAVGSVGGALAYRRASAKRREHVDLYFDDGSMVSLSEGQLDADRLLPIARDALAAARA